MIMATIATHVRDPKYAIPALDTLDRSIALMESYPAFTNVLVSLQQLSARAHEAQAVFRSEDRQSPIVEVVNRPMKFQTPEILIMEGLASSPSNSAASADEFSDLLGELASIEDFFISGFPETLNTNNRTHSPEDKAWEDFKALSTLI